MALKDILAGSIEAAKRRKNLIVFFISTHVILLFFGQWMVAQGYPGVLELREEQLKQIQELPYLKPLMGPLAENLPLKVLYTFSFNLIFGAFVSTTLTGLVFFFPYLVAVWRSFLVGILVAGMEYSPAMVAVFYGTFILEFGAYCISSAIGTDIGLALLFPERKGVSSRKEALGIAVRDGARLYVLVIIILFIAAIWEMSGLHYLGPMLKPSSG
ncbi:MAG: hypothetical protein A2054_00320 [Deltaproteobacteria bacterium GWA2_55_10]|nr:MAG: hypothetical protein A2054_00320 [Deltaproteobacteria bacterium GWA2_55_10]